MKYVITGLISLVVAVGVVWCNNQPWSPLKYSPPPATPPPA